MSREQLDDPQVRAWLRTLRDVTCKSVAHQQSLVTDIDKLLAGHDETVPFDALRPGQQIRVAGEWWRIRSITSGANPRLHLSAADDPDRRSWYPVSHGETFPLADPF